jgi:hypothetical protein
MKMPPFWEIIRATLFSQSPILLPLTK